MSLFVLEAEDNATFIHRTDEMGNITGGEEQQSTAEQEDNTETDTELERMATSEDQNTGTSCLTVVFRINVFFGLQDPDPVR
jgi:hypothetical protein